MKTDEKYSIDWNKVGLPIKGEWNFVADVRQKRFYPIKEEFYDFQEKSAEVARIKEELKSAQQELDVSVGRMRKTLIQSLGIDTNELKIVIKKIGDHFMEIICKGEKNNG